MIIALFFILTWFGSLSCMEQVLQKIADNKGIVVIIVDNENGKVITIEGMAFIQLKEKEITITNEEKKCTIL